MGHRMCFVGVVVMASVLNVCLEGKPQTFDLSAFADIALKVPSEIVPNNQTWAGIIHNTTTTGTPCGSYEAVRPSSLSDNINDSPSLLKEIGAMASLHSSSANLSSRTQVCGGVLISDRWVLTAAHCFTNDEISITTISLGRYDLDEDYNPGEDTYQIEECYLHPDYSRTTSTRYNDLALLFTDRTVQFKPTIFPFCLPNDYVMLDQNTFLQVAGFGHVNKTSKSPELKSIFVNLVENENCAQIFAYAAPGKIEEAYPDGLNTEVICASRPGVNACSGDSGGPLFHLDVDGGRTVDGLVSRGTDESCQHLTPVIYTNVVTYIDWIYNKTGLHKPDINECENDNGGCMHICTNTPGSFTCSCDSGFGLGTDKLSCYDKFHGPHDTIWSHEQCPSIESHSASLSVCKTLCVETSECTAITYSYKGFWRTSQCDLRNCTLPIPGPAVDHGSWKGFELITDECSDRCLEQFWKAAESGDLSYISAELGLVSNVSTRINSSDGTGSTALHIAALAGHASVVHALLEAGADPNTMGGGGGQTPMHIAAMQGYTAMLRTLLNPKYKADVNLWQAFQGETPATLAVQKGHTEALKVLIAHGANINKGGQMGNSPLMGVSSPFLGPPEETGRILIEGGAQVKYVSPNDGQTALHTAARWGNLDFVRLLLQNNADVGHADNDGQTALHKAAVDNNPDVIRLLLQNNTNVGHAGNDGRTALHVAAAYNSPDVVNLLLQNNADVGHADNDGQTALHKAADRYTNGTDVVRLLLQNNADVGHADNNGQTALHLAVENKSPDVALLLLQNKANKMHQDNKGFTPADIARQKAADPNLFYLDTPEEFNKLAEFIDNWQ